MAKIRQSNLDNSIVTGLTELSATASGSDILLIYDASSGTLKKIQASNVGLQLPTVTSVSPTNVVSGDGTGNYTFIITGTGYIASAIPTLIESGGSSVSFDSFTINSQTQITGTIAKSSLDNAQEPYDVRVTIAGALSSTLTDQINIDAQPAFNTASGSLGTFSEQTAVSVTIEATDPESAGAVGYEIIGSLPAGLTSSITSGILTISGTLSTDIVSLTTTTFTVKANDVASNTSTRSFSITERPSEIESFTSSGTFSVPSGVTTVNVLVVAGAGGGGGGGGRAGPPGDNGTGGGGGGAGGLIFRPGFPVTPSGTVSVTVGCGGGAATVGQDSVFGTLTAKGGGAGGSGPGGQGGDGGSGGGTAGASGGGGPASTATQPTQPGDSGTYGFGNAGGAATGDDWQSAGAGGGGAGAAGQTASGFAGTVGGVGRAYTIADGTTPVYYAGGGGGGGGHTGGGGGTPAAGGQGGGGAGGAAVGGSGTAGQANKGGAGGGGSQSPGGTPGTSGGKGIVIVQY